MVVLRSSSVAKQCVRSFTCDERDRSLPNLSVKVVFGKDLSRVVWYVGQSLQQCIL